MEEQRVVFYYAASADGFIADERGGVEWLLPFQTIDYGYNDFLSGIDTLVYGRTTYELEQSFGEWSHATKQTVVVSSTLQHITTPRTYIHNGGIPELIARLRRSNGTAWVVGGAKLMSSFFQHSGVDKIHVYMMPLFLGAGLSFKAELKSPVPLRLDGTNVFDNGVVHMAYSIK